MDFTGIWFSVLAAVVSVGGLWWHVALAKKGQATGRDRMLGAVWAAVLVLSLGRIVYLTSAGDGTKAPAPAPAQLPK
jgi:hypothetical protein